LKAAVFPGVLVFVFSIVSLGFLKDSFYLGSERLGAVMHMPVITATWEVEVGGLGLRPALAKA
jgi:hypothetical protein